MLIRIEINTDNDAFTDDPDRELARILTQIATSLMGHGGIVHRQAILDSNGNTCGEITMEET